MESPNIPNIEVLNRFDIYPTVIPDMMIFSYFSCCIVDGSGIDQDICDEMNLLSAKEMASVGGARYFAYAFEDFASAVQSMNEHEVADIMKFAVDSEDTIVTQLTSPHVIKSTSDRIMSLGTAKWERSKKLFERTAPFRDAGDECEIVFVKSADKEHDRAFALLSRAALALGDEMRANREISRGKHKNDELSELIAIASKSREQALADGFASPFDPNSTEWIGENERGREFMEKARSMVIERWKQQDSD